MYGAILGDMIGAPYTGCGDSELRQRRDLPYRIRRHRQLQDHRNVHKQQGADIKEIIGVDKDLIEKSSEPSVIQQWVELYLYKAIYNIIDITTSPYLYLLPRYQVSSV